MTAAALPRPAAGPSPAGGAGWALVPVAFAAVLVGAISLRYGGRWGENDTSILATAARGVLREGTITPASGAYDHGFAYPTLLATLAGVTGLPVNVLQMVVLPWFTLATALVAFVAFRAITRDARVGALSAIALLLQPDFLFVNQRGSHEKTTWTLVLTLLLVLVASLRVRRVPQVVPFVVAFYLAGFALLSTNAFFGTSFTTVLLLAAAGSSLVARWYLRVAGSRVLVRRFGYAFVILGLLAYVNMFFLYPPARSTLASAARITDRLASLYLDVEPQVAQQVTESSGVGSSAAISESGTTSSPYAAINLGWTSSAVFMALTSYTWLLIASGAFSWLSLAVVFARRGVSRIELPVFVVWIFVASSAAQILLSVSTDYAGVLGGNMQLRLFPVFTVFATPVVLSALMLYRRPKNSRVLHRAAVVSGLGGAMLIAPVAPLITLVAVAVFLVAITLVLTWNRALTRGVALTLGTLLFAYFTVASLAKATNDPLVSKKWVFYTDAEARGVTWANRALADTLVWGEFDERLAVASVLEAPDAQAAPAAYWTSRLRLGGVRYYLLSDVTAARAARIGAPLPNTDGTDRIYDNGRVQVAHQVPLTPYQP